MDAGAREARGVDRGRVLLRQTSTRGVCSMLRVMTTHGRCLDGRLTAAADAGAGVDADPATTAAGAGGDADGAPAAACPATGASTGVGWTRAADDASAPAMDSSLRRVALLTIKNAATPTATSPTRRPWPARRTIGAAARSSIPTSTPTSIPTWRARGFGGPRA